MTLTKQKALEKEQHGEGTLAVEGRHIVFRHQDGSSHTQWGFRSPAHALEALAKLRSSKAED